MLKIEVNNPKIIKYKGEPQCEGKITIGNYWETFDMKLNTWTINQYKHQWKEAFERLKTHDKSCFIADIDDTGRHLHYIVFYIYKVKEKLFVRWQMPTWKWLRRMSKGKPPFNMQTCYEYIPPFETHNEEGDPYEMYETDLEGIIAQENEFK